jgi:hypothetical protein
VIRFFAILLLPAFALAGTTHADGIAEAINKEMGPVLKKLKSVDPKERQAAVHTLLGIREAVSLRLMALVAKANQGNADAEAKAFAIALMGHWGLARCKDTLEAEKDWQLKVRTKEQFNWINEEGCHSQSIFGYPAQTALGRARSGTSVRVVRDRKAGDLAKFPILAEALVRLEAKDWDERIQDWQFLNRWYRAVCTDVGRTLSPSAKEPPPDDVKVTAAFILGEFRASSAFYLLWNIDLVDRGKICANYPAALSVETPDAAYPCVVALLKVGRKHTAREYLGVLSTKPQFGQEKRNLIARTAIAVFGDDARKQYAEKVAGLQRAVEAKTEPVDKWKKRLALLETVADIMEKKPEPATP